MPTHDGSNQRNQRQSARQPHYGHPAQQGVTDGREDRADATQQRQREAETSSNSTLDRLEDDARLRMRGTDDLAGGLPGTVATPGNEANVQTTSGGAGTRESDA